MNDTKINIFSRFFYSITSFARYRLFLRQSVGKAVLYLLLLSVLLSLAVYIPAGLQYDRFIDDLIANYDIVIPDFSFADGKLQVSGKMPIIVDEGTYPIVIDTSPDAEDRILPQYDTVMLITGDKIIQKNYANKQVTYLSVFQGLELARDDIGEALPLMKPVGIFIFILIAIGFVCGKFISALIISLIGLTINSALKTSLSYRNIFKISIYSMTLPLLVCTIPSVTSLTIPFLWILFYVIASVYVYGAIKSIRKEIDNMYGQDNMNNIS
jgi:hypothetical protein